MKSMFFLYVPMVFLGFSHGFGGFFSHRSSQLWMRRTPHWPMPSRRRLVTGGAGHGWAVAGGNHQIISFYGLGLGFFVGLADMAGWW